MKNGKIELLRFALALSIISFHSYTTIVLQSFMPLGYVAVDSFFAITGYLMVETASKKGEYKSATIGNETAHFILRKINSIFPNFIIAWMIGFVVTKSYLAFENTVELFWEISLLHMVGFGNFRVNGVDWYISAMLISMLILYPICRRNQQLFTRVIAPINAIFVYGFLYRFDLTGENGTYVLIGNVIYKGLFRAFGGISIGAAIWNVVKKMQKTKFRKFARVCISIIELLVWMCVYCSFRFVDNNIYDSLLIVLCVIGIILAFSHQGIYAERFDNKICMFLGRFSLSIYLSHVYWGRMIGAKLSDKLSCSNASILYYTLTFGTALTVHFLSLAITWIWKHNRKRIVNMIIEE